MSKEQMTIEELEHQKRETAEQIEKLKNIIDACDTSVFEIMIADIKEDMERNVAEEDWKSLKINKSKIDTFRNIVNVIQSQDTLLEKKEKELDNIENQLKYYQTKLNIEVKESPIVDTKIYIKDHGTVSTGAIFRTFELNKKTDSHEPVYYIVKKSAEKDNKFAILSNKHEGELLLNYPKNKKLLDDCEDYVGNIYDEYDNQEEAMACLKIIADYQETFKPNIESSK